MTKSLCPREAELVREPQFLQCSLHSGSRWYHSPRFAVRIPPPATKSPNPSFRDLLATDPVERGTLLFNSNRRVERLPLDFSAWEGGAGMERRLTAILSADVVGYSRLMEQDETGTLAALQRLRDQVVDPALDRFHGRIVKLMGDGALVEFPSVVDALSCAVEIQQTVSKWRGGEAGGPQLVLRIGIHLGDVIVEGDDIYGDGVNVASRLEGLSEPGGIAVSGQVYDAIGNNLNLGFSDLGEVKVKNIERSIRTFSVNLGEGGSTPAAARAHQARKSRAKQALALAGAVLLVLGSAAFFGFRFDWSGKREESVMSGQQTGSVAIAVLPFVNLAPDDEQDYFSSGMTEDLITDLSNISSFTVIASNSSFGYQGRTEDVQSVSQALGVGYLVKGSVRRSGDAVRINVQLIEGSSGAHLWAERFDRNLSDIFALQDEVIERIVSALSVELTDGEELRLASHSTESVAAYELYLQGQDAASRFSRSGMEEARRYYWRAVEIDPAYSMAYAQIANTLEIDVRAGWSSNAQADLEKAIRLAQKAVELDDDNPFAHWTLGRVAKISDRATVERAVASVQRAIELRPSYADAFAYLTYLYIGLGQTEKAEKAIAKAMRLNPLYPFWYLHARAVLLFMKSDYEGAIEDLEEAANRNPTVPFVRWWLAAAYAAAGRPDDAAWQADEMQALGITSTVSIIMDTSRIIHPPFRDKYEKALLDAGIPH